MLTSAKPHDVNPSLRAALQGKATPSSWAMSGLLTRSQWDAMARAVQQELARQPGPAGVQSALKLVESHLESYPDCVDLLFLRAQFLDNLGRDHEATEAYRVVLARDPKHRVALVNFANRLYMAGMKAEALKIYLETVAWHPGDAMSQVNLGNMLLRMGQFESARRHFDHALAIDPNYRHAHMALSHVLPLLNEPEQGTVHRIASFKGQCILSLPYRGERAPIAVLLLISVTGLSVRFKEYLSDRFFLVHMVATQFYDPAIPLPPHDLVINAIGDVDSDPVALAGAESLLRYTQAPVLNQPSAVLPTGRCENAERLARIPGVRTATTVTLSRAALERDDLSTLLAGHGLSYPILLRTPGCHGGDHFLMAASSAELPEVLRQLPGDSLMVMQYLDGRAADGLIRKYRVMMIDGQLYPLHLAISANWKIHYFSADMAGNPANRAEDAAFLDDMAAALGPIAMAALRDIQRTLALDYAGIDFGLNDRGEVLVYEANATMAVVVPDSDRRWDYRRPAVDRIYRAISKMLVEHSGHDLALYPDLA